MPRRIRRSIGFFRLGRCAESSSASHGRVLARGGLRHQRSRGASLVPQVVTDKELPSASTLNGVQFIITSILGPAVAGVLLTRVGAPVVFALNAVGFLLVFTAIPSLGKTGSAVSQTLVSFLRSIPSTFAHVKQAQNVGNILARNAIFSFFVVAIPALAPVLLLKELRLDASSLGLVFASMGVGSVISAIFVIPWLRSRFATDTLMIIAQVTLAGVYILMAMVHHCLSAWFRWLWPVRAGL